MNPAGPRPNYCRMCIHRDNNFEFIPMVDRHGHLRQKFERCFNLPLNPRDNHVICVPCADKLIEIAMIYQMVHDSDVYLKKQSQPQDDRNFMGPARFQFKNTMQQQQQNNQRFQDKQYNEGPSRNNTHWPHQDQKPNNNNRQQNVNPFAHPRRRMPPNSAAASHENFGIESAAPPYNETLEISDSEDDNNNSNNRNNNNNGSNVKNSFIQNGKRIYPCSVCDRQFMHAIQRRNHYIRFHPEMNRFKCSVCSEAFQFKNGLKLHMKVFDHLKCEKCNEKFNDYGILMNHKQKCFIHCQFCAKQFGSEVSLNAHQRAVHGNEINFLPGSANQL